MSLPQDPLDQILAVDTDEEPRPGFDTRFHARLAEAKSGKQRRWWLALIPVVGAAAVALGIVVFQPRHQTVVNNGQPVEPSDIDVAIALDYDMLANYDVVADLETIEAFELLAANDVPTKGSPQ